MAFLIASLALQAMSLLGIFHTHSKMEGIIDTLEETLESLGKK